MRIKSCPVQLKAVGEQDDVDAGVFEAIVAAYNLDSYGDKIVPGAFADTIAEWKSRGDPIPVLWSHRSADPACHIGVVEDIEERKDGLWVRAKLDLDDESPTAKRVYRLLKGRRVTQFSFAYEIAEGAWIEKTENGKDSSYYELRKLKLYEVGPTLIGANQETELLDVKSRDGRSVHVALSGTLPDEADAIRIAVETALGGDGGSKASTATPPVYGVTVVPVADPTALAALDTLADAVQALRKALDPATAPRTTDVTTATPAPVVADSAASAAKADDAAAAPASVRLLADLFAATAEV